MSAVLPRVAVPLDVPVNSAVTRADPKALLFPDFRFQISFFLHLPVKVVFACDSSDVSSWRQKLFCYRCSFSKLGRATGRF